MCEIRDRRENWDSGYRGVKRKGKTRSRKGDKVKRKREKKQGKKDRDSRGIYYLCICFLCVILLLLINYVTIFKVDSIISISITRM